MSYFKNRHNVDVYTDMMTGFDNHFVITQVQKVLPVNASLLELGMGTGLDLVSLSTYYQVVGSDYSPHFIDDFKRTSDLEVYELDAITLGINRKFDCIYSNKVLQHLPIQEMRTSLINQCLHLNENGIIFMTLWHGSHREEFEFDGQLRFIYYDRDSMERLVPEGWIFKHFITYAEFEAQDSIIVVLGQI